MSATLGKDQTTNGALGLPQSVVVALLRGRHARKGGTTPRKRGQNLSKIAASYTREEILTEPGIGPRNADRIETWLATQGLGYRCEKRF
ncbi:hypothetical protein OCA5_pHCG301110 (plasmid) [Afipia carboxidovorans OM5]|uniref:Uncharacterized protein n=1 Tax=Afipia carboxidovorans (strain ATCC 49405 / DSM 1227 / KCTC 32145 / OM5) TaxID=504832 RepID=F8C174_AFIC5|nr:hypothetical protein [Afipia carboxidovorans]AEI04555.1 hypothetical protein OCA4_pHCG3B01100 [Afipia carboxidovorans OM4]AEI08184.1 hypothetical protein OCA5_pHCG301110 [Afipia carboxidovorans OM5]